MNDLKFTDSATSIDEQDFVDFVNQYGLNLPEDYKQFMLNQNGGFPELNYLITKEGLIFEIDSFSINDSFSFEDDLLMSANYVIETNQIAENNIPKNYFPFANSISNHTFCISMDEKDYGKIYLYILDGSRRSPKFVSSSFKEFVDGMRENEEDDED